MPAHYIGITEQYHRFSMISGKDFNFLKDYVLRQFGLSLICDLGHKVYLVEDNMYIC